jgi:hypothetical protein
MMYLQKAFTVPAAPEAVDRAISYRMCLHKVVPLFLSLGTMQCAFCKKAQDALARLISSPKDYGPLYNCDECVRICSAEATNQSGSSDAARCSFCHKGRDTVRLFSSSREPPNATICEECLAVCKDVLQDISPTRPNL